MQRQNLEKSRRPVNSRPLGLFCCFRCQTQDSLTFIHIIAEIERKYDIEFSSDMLNVTDKLNVDTIYNKIQELREGTNNEK